VFDDDLAYAFESVGHEGLGPFLKWSPAILG
jgi:hypothetical protein